MLIMALTLVVIFSMNTVAAPLSSEQRKLIQSGVEHFDIERTPINSGSCGGASTLAGGDNQEKTWNFLVGKGLTAIQAAGAMGNMQHEGNFNPKIVEGGRLVNGAWTYQNPRQFPREMDTIPPHNLAPIVSGKYAGQPGYGIVQWTSPGRKEGLKTFAASKSLPVYDLALQLDYMWSELEGPYKTRALDPLMKATDLAEAVRIWQEKYEVGAHFQPRMDAAEDWLAKYGSGTSGSDGTGGCQLDASGCPSGPVDRGSTVSAEGITVHGCISEEVTRIMQLAKQQGLNLTGDGWVSKEGQEAKRQNNGCGGSKVYDEGCRGNPVTAVPGKSRHERGTAIDFSCGGLITSRSHACFKFLQENTKLINLEEEPWHWSIDGS